MLSEDEKFMQRCLELAEKGRGNTAPNPMVGSVIVYNGRIIGEGYHRHCGEAHAEVNAVEAVRDKSLLEKSTLYVNLEPCAHQGRTPACSLMIIEKRIPKVVIGCIDPFAKVAGKGVQMLREAGVEVVVGVLEHESRQLNRRFFTFHLNKRPYIILKWAQSLDGFLDFVRSKDTPIQPNWITDEYARMLVHRWRAEESAVMVGTNTAEKDNPKLDVRDWTGKNPTRIVLDRRLRLPENLNLFDGTIPTLIFTEKTKKNQPNTEYIRVDFDKNVFDHIFNELYKRDILSLIVEGGADLINSLLKQNLWDEARYFVGKKLFYAGVAAPKINQEPGNIVLPGNSTLYQVYNSPV